jgi:hypothetical protein
MSDTCCQTIARTAGPKRPISWRIGPLGRVAIDLAVWYTRLFN